MRLFLYGQIVSVMCAVIVMWGVLYGNALASQTPAQVEESRQYLIQQLTAQLSILQALLADVQKGSRASTPAGKASVTITNPKEFEVVRDGAPYTVKWDMKNVPPSTMLVIETNAVQLTGASGIGGGTALKIVKPGDTSDARVFNTGVGYSDPGIYRIRLLLLACLDMLCTKTPIHTQSDGTTAYDSTVVAQTDWVRYSINENPGTENTSGISITTIRPAGEDTVQLGRPMTMSFTVTGLTGSNNRACFAIQDVRSGFFNAGTAYENGCLQVGNGTHTYTWTPRWTTGFQLNPGLYRAYITIENPPTTSGKDYGNAAEAFGTWFRLNAE